MCKYVLLGTNVNIFTKVNDDTQIHMHIDTYTGAGGAMLKCTDIYMHMVIHICDIFAYDNMYMYVHTHVYVYIYIYESVHT